MGGNILLEAPVFTIEAALLAQEYGVDRIELCSDFSEGGETPSVGALAFLKERISIPIYVMIRPRGGDFVYSREELEVMKKDIQILESHGADGFVFGVLTAEGDIDINSCSKLLEVTKGKPSTFHRAFDICRNSEDALEKIINCGFQRVLTSGNHNSVSDGIEVILKLLDQAQDRIIILPGGGLRPSDLDSLKKSRFLKEVHASCKKSRPTNSKYQSDSVRLSNDPQAFKQVLSIDENIVKNFKSHLIDK